MKKKNQAVEIFTKIKVLGIGGAGGNIVNRIFQEKIRGIELAAVNTDLQALHFLHGPKKLQIGKNLTKGLGSGKDPSIGRQAAEENQKEIQELLKGTDLLFLVCGLGGGTGSGATPVIAEMAKNSGILTIAVVTKPFGFEGKKRQEIAEKSLEELKNKVDTIVTIANDRLLEMIDQKTTFLQAIALADEVLKQGIRGISEIIIQPGLINVDFADIKTVMREAGPALMGIGIGQGETRILEAAQKAMSNPLLDLSLDGAQGIIFCVRGGEDLTMSEISEAAKIITRHSSRTAKIIFGASIDPHLKDEVRVTVIATGFGQKEKEKKKEGPREEKRIIFDLTRKTEDLMPAKKTEKLFSEKILVDEKELEMEEELEIPAFLRKKMG